MAYKKAVYTASSASATSLSITFATALVANDLVVCFGAVRSASATLAITGYTGIGTQQNNDAWSSRPFVYRASGGETSLSITTGSSAAAMLGTAYVLGGVSTSGTAADQIDTSAANTGATGWTMTSGNITTGSANCLVIDAASWDVSFILADPTSLNIQSGVYVATSGHHMITGIRLKSSAGAVSTFTWTANNNTNGGIAWTVAIKDDGNANLPVLLTDGRTYLDQMGMGATPTVGAPNSVTGLTTIATIAMHSAASTFSNSSMPSTVPWQIIPGRFAWTGSVGASDAWVGGFIAMPATRDISNKNIFIPVSLDTGSTATNTGTNGNIVVYVDSSNNWVAYQLLPFSHWTAGGYATITIRPGVTTEFASSLASGGSAVDLTDIVTEGYFTHRLASATTAVSTYYAPAIYETATTKVIGGGASNTINVKKIAKLLSGGLSVSGGMYPDHCSFQGNGQLVSKFGLQFGDGGTTATNVVLTAQSIETPSYENTLWRAGNNAAPIYIYGGASDTYDLRSAILSTEYSQPFEFNASHNTSATVYTSGLSIVGPWSPVWKDGETESGISYTGNDTVAISATGATLLTISSTAASGTGSAAASVAANGTLTSSTIDGTGAEYALKLGTSVTAYTLTDCTLTAGTTGNMDKVYVAATTGTVTITISGTTSLVAGDVTSAGATVVIAAPELYQSVTISGLTSGSRVQIYDTTAATELANSTQASPGSNVTWASATAMTWTDPVAAATDRTIRVRIAYVSGTSAKGFIEANIGTCGTTDGTEAVSYLANQVDDAVYNTNGIDGPSIYATSGITFTDSGSNDRINCNISGGAVSWGTIYACFAYWMSTSTGIADDIAYVTAVDTANYLLDSLKIKNTSATPLTITGGWGRDATSLTIADCIDTAGSTGNIFPQPDHVVAYATGSGSLTAGDITNIWSNGSRTLTTTIPSASDNATAVASVAVDGDVTLAESMRLQNAMLAGKVSGAGTGTEVFRSLADDKDRATVTVDSVGNRSAVVRDLT